MAKSGRRSSLGAKFMIHWLVTILVDHRGLTATRNDASEERSACDAVAQAMSQLGRKPASYERIKAVFMEVARMEECGSVAEPEEPTTID